MREWRALVRRRLAGQPDRAIDPDPDIIEELAQHLEDRYRALVARGCAEPDAVAQALRELEGHERLGHELVMARAPIVASPAQDVSRGGVTAIADDLRFAWRRLKHSKGFTAAAVLTLTLAVGANTAILSVADAVLFRPLPYADPDDVYVIQMLQRLRGERFVSTPYPVLDAIDQSCPSISEVGLIRSRSLVVETPDGAASVAIADATSNYFTILGTRPEHGRVFDARDQDSPGRVAVLTHSTWRQRFGGDPAIVGRAITLGTTTFEVIGVLPAGFVVPSQFAGRPELITVGVFPRVGTGGAFHPVVRVTQGMSRERAQAELDAATASVLSTMPDMLGSGPVLDDVRAVIYPVGRPVMRYLLAASGLILLLACANLANMLLVRGRRTMRDTAVRLALGANRIRLIRPIFLEALLIGILGAVLALALTWTLFDAMLRQVPAAAYGQARVGVDGRVAAMSLTMGLASALLFAIVPAWRAAGSDVLALMQPRDASRRPRLGRPMVVAQVAIAVAVVFGAAISGRTFLTIVRGTLGFNPENVIVIDVTPAPSVTNRQGFYRRIIDTLSERSDVLAAGAGAIPLTARAPDEPAEVNGEMRAGIAHALPGYFDATAIPVISGRAFTWDDAERNPDVAVVSSSAARALFGDRDPLAGTISSGTGRQFTVIGVVGDTQRIEGWRGRPEVYVMPLVNRGVLTVVVRLRVRSEAALTSVVADVRSLVGSRVVTAAWWSDRIDAMQTRRDPRFQALVLGSLGALALGLMALGTFSVVAYLVSARTREMGVRLAVGASPRGLMALFLRQSLISVSVGVVAGLLLIGWGSQLIDARVIRVDAGDPAMLAAAVITVFGAAGLATYLPARRALRINPAEVLRAE